MSKQNDQVFIRLTPDEGKRLGSTSRLMRLPASELLVRAINEYAGLTGGNRRPRVGGLPFSGKSRYLVVTLPGEYIARLRAKAEELGTSAPKLAREALAAVYWPDQ